MAMKSKYTDIDLNKYDAGFQGNDEITTALNKKNEANSAVENYGDFSFTKQGVADKVENDYLNRKDFTYDLNGDALYQQYKENYINQGKQAMMDTMGQAAAMTGGYGNSYAATVGNQTYQGHLQNLNNIVPELYQLALDRYNAEGQNLKDKYSILASERDFEYGMYTDKYNRLLADRDYYSGEYDSAYNRGYTAWNDKRTYDTNQYWNEHNAGYTAEQDAIANEMARQQLEETIRANQAAEQLQREQIAATRASKSESSLFGGFTAKEFTDAMKLAAEEGNQKYAQSLVEGADSDAAMAIYNIYFGDKHKSYAYGTGANGGWNPYTADKYSWK